MAAIRKICVMTILGLINAIIAGKLFPHESVIRCERNLILKGQKKNRHAGG
jgi:hypothetical protein